MLGSAVFANPDDACSPLQPIKRESRNSQSVFILIERGNCDFVTKAHFAEIAGAKLAIIIDEKDGEDPSSFVASDDGMG